MNKAAEGARLWCVPATSISPGPNEALKGIDLDVAPRASRRQPTWS